MAWRTPLLDRLADKFTVGDGCWEWIAGKDPCGYGHIMGEGHETLKAHRVLYEALHGPIPEGRELDHLCRVRHCVRPDHLEVVTHAENVARGLAGVHHAVKTHCPQGHAFDEANTYIRPDRPNRRECRACRNGAVLRSRTRRS